MTNVLDMDGFDPLSIDISDPETTRMLDDQNRRIVSNILKSYTGYFDLFSELIQNALDAMEAKSRTEANGYRPEIWIHIDIQGSKIRVVDNGVGMDAHQLRYFAKPNVSFKKPREYRGQKGVGANFLAYGFSLIRIHTRKDRQEYAVNLRQGRQWAQDQHDTVPRPKFSTELFGIPELSQGQDGTAVEVVVGGVSGERPKRFDWIGARTAQQWADVLRIKTPIGGIYLRTSSLSPIVNVKVTDSSGNVTFTTLSKPEYYYPHEMADIKVGAVTDIEKALHGLQGSTDERYARLDSQYKRLDCLWEIYDTKQIVDEDWWFSKTLDDDQRALVRKHNVVIYSAFLRSAKMWGELNEEILGLNKGQRVIRGGLQLASDFMAQGDLTIIPLTSTIGYQANTHIIVHFMDGSPDMGRKAFQPELEELAKRLAVQCVNIFKRYLQNLKPDSGAVAITPDKELHEWKRAQEQYRDRKSLSFKAANGNITLLSEPQQEQDVIALFHQLIGLNLIRGIKFFSTSQSERYDSLYLLDYDPDEDIRYSKTNNPLGIGPDSTLPYPSEPRVLEYKYDLDALTRDFANDVKYPKHINFVVFWKATKQFKEKYYLNSLLVGDEGASRLTFGATHLAFADGNQQPDFEVCILEDLLGYLMDPMEEEHRQRQKYKD
ncbi:MAG: hypothetical protein WCL10_03310 [Novosphingobium sp.]|uniref:hypothetical protein n=1 Tax=Novosphingobium sp. TaxID=1874826 RepID=UPI003018FC70